MVGHQLSGVNLTSARNNDNWRFGDGQSITFSTLPTS